MIRIKKKGGRVTIVTSDPVSGTNGDLILNSITGLVKVWYQSAWFTIGRVGAIEFILLENGDNILLENGDEVLKEYNFYGNTNTGWSTTNYTEDKIINVSATSLNEVANVLSTLIRALEGYGILGP